MEPEETGRGSTGDVLSANVRRLRESKNLSLRRLAQLTADAGYPLGHIAISQLEKGLRRVDVDDLFALAAALEVAPATLLIPSVDSGDEVVEATAVGSIRARDLWRWMRAESALPEGEDAPIDLDWMLRARPKWTHEDEATIGAVLAKYLPLLERIASDGDD